MGGRQLAIAAILVAVGTARAQQAGVPGAPPLPGGPTPPAASGATGAGTGAATGGGGGGGGRNIWSFFMKTPEQKAQCKANFCNSRIGLFVNNLLVPAGAATGGLLGPICPPPGLSGGPGGAGGPPNPEDLKKPATSPEGAAAKIKAEEAKAKAKIAALEYLGTVDCRYYPEAEAGLIAGLRAEKVECVRLAAAKAIANGCCCSPKVVKALMICVNCSTADGFPAEASELVRTYAYVALERCLRRCVQAEPEMPPEPPPAAKKAMYEILAPMGETVSYSAQLLLAAYYPMQPTETRDELFAAARQLLARGLSISPQTLARLSGPKNVVDSVFPPESRPDISLTTLKQFTSAVTLPTLPSFPSLPSFAAIRRHAVGLPLMLREAPFPRSRPVGEPALESVPQANVRRPPMLVMEREIGIRPPASSVALFHPPPVRPLPVSTAAGVEQLVGDSKPARTWRPGRANILNIVQDGWRR